MEVLRLVKVRSYLRKKQTVTVGLGDYIVSSNPKVLATYALGSCVAILFYNDNVKVGALIHAMLPYPREAWPFKPGKYVSTAIPHVLKKFQEMKISKRTLVSGIIGGANILNMNSVLNIGKRNVEKAREILNRENIPIVLEDVGGTRSRSVYFDLEEGVVYISSPRTSFMKFS